MRQAEFDPMSLEVVGALGIPYEFVAPAGLRAGTSRAGVFMHVILRDGFLQQVTKVQQSENLPRVATATLPAETINYNATHTFVLLGLNSRQQAEVCEDIAAGWLD